MSIRSRADLIESDTHQCDISDLGRRDEAEHEVSVGVAGILKTVASLTNANSGQFWNFMGERVPW